MARRRRRSYDGYPYFPDYVSAAEKKEKARKSLMKLREKNSTLKPVVIEGTVIAKSWWGKSWNKNLEGYADYSNRIDRGRSYVRSGAVLDLQIKPGEIAALVQGSRSKPYSVTIRISGIAPDVLDNIKKACTGKLDSLNELLAGKFPKELEELFTGRGTGLFPSPREIVFLCTCPDYAAMCKHVAAALYGVSVHLDTEPGLFFTLRKIEFKDLVGEAVQNKSQELLARAKKKSSRVLEDSDLSAVFGIQLDDKPCIEVSPAAAEAKPEVSNKKKSTVSKKESKMKAGGKPIPAPKTKTRSAKVGA